MISKKPIPKPSPKPIRKPKPATKPLRKGRRTEGYDTPKPPPKKK